VGTLNKIAVLGLGQSISLFLKEPPFDFSLTVGVNDIYRHVKTDIIVCVDRPSAFTPERLRFINDATPKYFYSQMVDWDRRPDFRKINIISGYPDRGLNLNQPGYWKSYCSPFIAVQVAYRMHEANEIHLFGVDLTNHPHLDRDLCKKIKIHFTHLINALHERNCQVIVHGNGILTL